MELLFIFQFWRNDKISISSSFLQQTCPRKGGSWKAAAIAKEMIGLCGKPLGVIIVKNQAVGIIWRSLPTLRFLARLLAVKSLKCCWKVKPWKMVLSLLSFCFFLFCVPVTVNAKTDFMCQPRCIVFSTQGSCLAFQPCDPQGTLRKQSNLREGVLFVPENWLCQCFEVNPNSRLPWTAILSRDPAYPSSPWK